MTSQIPEVAVIMSTYNGEKYLAEQIDSILAQKDVHVELFIRDDGSKDSTREIISDYVSRYDNIHAEFGSNLGWIKSFVSALGSAPDFDYYAMSDQDDVWLEEKLITAVKAIQQKENAKGKDIPIICQTSAYIADQNLNVIGSMAYRDKRLKTIYSLAIRPTALGCCMVMNSKAREFAKHKNHEELFCRGYDISIVLFTVACGGIFFTEDTPLMKYRQHGHNVIGTPTSILKRMKFEYDRRFVKERGEESRFAKVVLQYLNDEMTREAKKVFTLIAGSKEKWLYRLIMFFSPKFRTGDIRVTLIEKFRILMGVQ